MYFCIFGFHRFVWWPKCTPASSNSFIVSAAIRPPSVGSSAALRRLSGADRIARGVRDDCLRRVFRVDAQVLLAQVPRRHPLVAAADAAVGGAALGWPSHALADRRTRHALARDA